MAIGSEKIGEMYIELLTKMNRMEADMKKATRTAKVEGGKTAKSFGESFKRILGTLGIALLIKKAFSFAIAAKNAARDAIEIQNKFDEVFISIKKGANRMAVSFANSFGLAQSSAKEFLSSTGDILVGFGFTEKAAFDMSLQVNELAQDLASFANLEGGAEQAANALTKALVGETESAKALGIVIRQDNKEFKNNVAAIMQAQGVSLIQAKSIEILRIAYEQSGKAVGDFARTQHQLANAERILSERIKEITEKVGAGLIPIFTGMVGVLNLLLTPTKTLTEEYELQKNSVEALEERLNPLLGTYKELKSKGGDVSKVIQQIANIMPEAVTQWDSYGNAVEISTGKIDEMLIRQQLLTKHLKGEAIKSEIENLKFYASQLATTTAVLNKFQKTGEEQRFAEGAGLITVKLGSEEAQDKIRRLRSAVNKLNDSFIGAVENLKAMNQEIPEEFVERYERLLSAKVGTGNNEELKVTNAFVKDILENYKLTKGQIESIRDALKNMKLDGEERIHLQEILNSMLGVEVGSNKDLVRTSKEYLETLKLITEQRLAFRSAQVDEKLKKPFFTFGDRDKLKPTELIDTSGMKDSAEILEDAFEKMDDSTDNIDQKFISILNAGASLSVILDIGAHTFIGIMLTGLNKINSAVNSIMGIISAFTGGGGGGLLGLIFGGATGGTFKSTGSGITKMAGGGSFLVPNAGRSGDYFPLMLGGGEVASVTPANKVIDNTRVLAEIRKGINNLSENMVSVAGGNSMPVNIELSIDGRELTKETVLIQKQLEREGETFADR